MLSNNHWSLLLRNSKGVIQGVALLGISVAGALLLQVQGTGAASSTSTSASGTATSDPVDYEFGTIQLKVTEASGKIQSIDLIQAGANGGREQAFSYLVEESLAVNGISFSNISGATYTVDAYKQALTNALSKIG